MLRRAFCQGPERIRVKTIGALLQMIAQAPQTSEVTVVYLESGSSVYVPLLRCDRYAGDLRQSPFSDQPV